MDTVTQTIQSVPLNHYILFSTIIFAIVVMGVLIRRNAIVIFMSVELMLNAINLLLTAFSAYRGDAAGQRQAAGDPGGGVGIPLGGGICAAAGRPP